MEHLYCGLPDVLWRARHDTKPTPFVSWTLEQPAFVDHSLPTPITLEGLKQKRLAFAAASFAELYLGLLGLPPVLSSRF